MRKLRLCSATLALALSLALPTTFAQRKDAKPKAAPAAKLTAARGVDTISAAQLRNYLSFIASDEMEGRDTPSRGLDTTAKFIAMNLERWGFKPAGDDGTFFQRITLRRDILDGAHHALAAHARHRIHSERLRQLRPVESLDVGRRGANRRALRLR